jgi:hypothetical protein
MAASVQLGIGLLIETIQNFGSLGVAVVAARYGGIKFALKG